MIKDKDIKIAIIGLGYVGLPLAVEFGKSIPTFGFDINHSRVDELKSGKDSTLECSSQDLQDAKYLHYTTDVDAIAKCNVYIVTVPTPINTHKQPDLTPLIKASEMVGGILCQNDVVIYESTVYPGCTEEICVPILEKYSALNFNQGFYVGYSPERINPGDKEHRLPSIKKVTSGSTPECAKFVNELYLRIITAGTHLASSLKVAEAAKVIENTQRDVNIALVNELAKIFNKLDIDTLDVLEAAGTKWNFLPFRPGLVGGHCISVDPYYLTHKAQEIGYQAEVILSGRRINDGMGAYVASQVIKLMNNKKILANGSRVLLLGLAFKEDCPDIRNTRVVDIIDELETFGAMVEVIDPWIDISQAKREYPNLNIIEKAEKANYDAIIISVGHKEFISAGIEEIKSFGKEGAILFDVKSIFDVKDVTARL